MTWFLVFMSATTYLGPMSKDDCERGKTVFQTATCREARVFTACEVQGHGGMVRVCPDFYAEPIQ
jgi:hypothetical protein